MSQYNGYSRCRIPGPSVDTLRKSLINGSRHVVVIRNGHVSCHIHPIVMRLLGAMNVILIAIALSAGTIFNFDSRPSRYGLSEGLASCIGPHRSLEYWQFCFVLQCCDVRFPLKILPAHVLLLLMLELVLHC